MESGPVLAVSSSMASWKLWSQFTLGTAIFEHSKQGLRCIQILLLRKGLAI